MTLYYMQDSCTEQTKSVLTVGPPEVSERADFVNTVLIGWRDLWRPDLSGHYFLSRSLFPVHPTVNIYDENRKWSPEIEMKPWKHILTPWLWNHSDIIL